MTKTITLSDSTMKLLFEQVTKKRMNNLKLKCYSVISYDSFIYDLLTRDNQENDEVTFENAN